MDKKKIALMLLVVCVLAGGYFVYHKSGKTSHSQTAQMQENTLNTQENNSTTTVSKIQQNTVDTNEGTKKGEVEKTTSIKHGNLYNSTQSGMLPLSAIMEIAEQPSNIQSVIDNINDSGNTIFFVKKQGDKILVVTENLDNIRHGIDFVEISVPTGHQTRSTLGYNGKIKDSENDIWEYDTNSSVQIPTKHTKYNKDGDIEFVETWNYDSENPIKYEMKNADGKTLSLRKETLKDGVDLRVEHLVYDSEGKTKINVTTTYEGADIKRFTYYNSDKPSQGGSVFSEYEDGLKVKETVYTSDLKVQNVYTSQYKDGERENITVFDNNNQKIGVLEK